MPVYSFKCEHGCRFDASYSMDDVPRQRRCQYCEASAVRLITSVNLSRAGSPAFKAAEASLRSAHEPEVVTRLPQQAGRPARVTRDPRHAKLPRT